MVSMELALVGFCVFVAAIILIAVAIDWMRDDVTEDVPETDENSTHSEANTAAHTDGGAVAATVEAQDIRPHYEHVSARLDGLDAPDAAVSQLAYGMDLLADADEYDEREKLVDAATERFKNAANSTETREQYSLVQELVRRMPNGER